MVVIRGLYCAKEVCKLKIKYNLIFKVSGDENKIITCTSKNNAVTTLRSQLARSVTPVLARVYNDALVLGSGREAIGSSRSRKLVWD